MPDQPPPKPPFDPLWGAWVLLLVLILVLACNSAFLFVGCALLRIDAVCAKSGANLTTVALELITGIAVLLSQRR